MKFRKDFVTNSSSSSYICEITGDTRETYNGELESSGLIQCVNEHVFDDSYVIDNFTLDQWKKDFIDLANKYIEENLSSIESRKTYNTDEEQKEYEQTITEDNKGLRKNIEDVKLLKSKKEIDDFYEQTEVFEEIESDLGSNILFKCQCPICSMKIASKSDYKRYVNKIYKLNEEKIKSEILNKFKTYEELENFLNEKD